MSGRNSQVMTEYFREVESYLRGLNDYTVERVSGVQEGDKYMSQVPVGGRFYKEIVLEYNGTLDVEDWNRESELNLMADEVKTNLFQYYESKYFTGSDYEEHCVVQAGCKDAEKGKIWIKPHCIPNPE